MRSYLTVRTNKRTIITKIANQKYKNQNDLIRLGVFAAVNLKIYGGQASKGV